MKVFYVFDVVFCVYLGVEVFEVVDEIDGVGGGFVVEDGGCGGGFIGEVGGEEEVV